MISSAGATISADPGTGVSCVLHHELPFDLRDRQAVFLGVPVHCLTMAETIDYIIDRLRAKKPLHQVSLNVAKLMNLRDNAELRADVLSADIVSADGMGIVIGARLMGVCLPERVAGVDVMEQLLERCASEGYRPYFLGATAEVLSRAMDELARRYPTLVVAGSRHGYYTAAEEEAIVAAIKASRPDCLFVGMPTPRKERFMARHHADLGIPYVMGVGGSIDILAGHVLRAPVWMQQAGLEWLYRIVQEPRRMWRRYAKTNLKFAAVLSVAVIRRLLRLEHLAFASRAAFAAR